MTFSVQVSGKGSLMMAKQTRKLPAWNGCDSKKNLHGCCEVGETCIAGESTLTNSWLGAGKVIINFKFQPSAVIVFSKSFNRLDNYY